MTKNTFRTLWVGCAALTVTVSFVTCATTVTNTPQGRTELPLVANVAPAASAANERPHTTTFSLESFTPLLALVETQEVREAVDRGAPDQAAARLAPMLKAGPPRAGGAPAQAWYYLLGSLEEQAGHRDAAASAYERSIEPAWQLSDYGRLALGQVLLAQGKAKQALEQLARINASGAIQAPTERYRAEAHASLAEMDAAIALWRAQVQRAPDAEPTLSLRLARALHERHRPESPAAPLLPDALAALDEALALSRRVIRLTPGGERRQQALDLEQALIALLPPVLRQERQKPSMAEQQEELEALVSGRQNTDAITLADTLLQRLPKEQRYGTLACEVRLLRAKALSQDRKWGDASDYLGDVVRFCNADKDLSARALFLRGRYAASDARHMLAVQSFEQLEREHPAHRLADDARLRAAHSYLEVGVEARFTELLAKMPDDYPAGDMVLEGIFSLAVRRIEKGDWSGAASVLEPTLSLPRAEDASRGNEEAGRERYFLARAREHLGRQAEALDEYEAIVREFPFSYYMLHAYTRLRAADAERAGRAVEKAQLLATNQPFEFASRAEHEAPAFKRATELLRVGELSLARAELAELGVGRSDAQAELLWGVALLYSRAGAERLAHQMTRGVLTDWLEHWPAGDWVKAWHLAFPRPYLALAQREAKRNQIHEAWIYGVMREESAFDADAVSSANAYGLMQLIVPTAKHYARPVGLPFDSRSLQNPRVNIALGARVLADLQARFSDNPLLAIPGYNAGPGRPERWRRERPNLDFDLWVELIPFRETRRYTKRVLASRATYASLYSAGGGDQVLTLPLKVGGQEG